TMGGLVSYFSVGSGPMDITAGPDKNMWFSENTAMKIGKLAYLQYANEPQADPCGCDCCGGGGAGMGGMGTGDSQMAQTGNLRLVYPLDFNQSRPTNGDYLVYNSSTVSVQPIIETVQFSDLEGSVPSQLQAQLTWNNGTPQAWVTFSTTGHSAGDLYA